MMRASFALALLASVTGSVGVSGTAAASPGADLRPPALTLSASGELVSRRFGYRDDLFGELRRYRADFRPGVAAGAVWHPAVHLDQGSERLRRLGVAARYLLVPAFDTRTAEGERYPTTASSFRVGLRWRQPIGRLVLSGIADYAGRSFELEQGQALRRPEIPGVRYRLLRVGASARRPIADRWTAGGALAYRHVLESGEIESTAYFSRSTALGVDGALWVGRRLASRLDLRLSAALERYAYTLNPEPGDFMVAGGALDQYLTFSVALRYRDL